MYFCRTELLLLLSNSNCNRKDLTIGMLSCVSSLYGDICRVEMSWVPSFSLNTILIKFFIRSSFGVPYSKQTCVINCIKNLKQLSLMCCTFAFLCFSNWDTIESNVVLMLMITLSLKMSGSLPRRARFNLLANGIISLNLVTRCSTKSCNTLILCHCRLTAINNGLDSWPWWLRLKIVSIIIWHFCTK